MSQHESVTPIEGFSYLTQPQNEKSQNPKISRKEKYGSQSDIIIDNISALTSEDAKCSN